MRNPGLFLLGCTLIACTSPGSVAGKVGGYDLDVKDVIFAPLSSDPHAIKVLLTDQDNVCDRVRAGNDLKNSSALIFQLERRQAWNDMPMPILPGDYTVNPKYIKDDSVRQAAYGNFMKNDERCHSVVPLESLTLRSGVVTITGFSEGGMIEGAFDVTVGTQGDRLTGRFSGTYCAPTSSDAGPSCL